MVDLGLEFHHRRSERVLGWYLDINKKGAILVGCARRAPKGPSKVCQIILRSHGLRTHLGVSIIVYVRNFLRNAAVPV